MNRNASGAREATDLLQLESARNWEGAGSSYIWNPIKLGLLIDTQDDIGDVRDSQEEGMHMRPAASHALSWAGRGYFSEARQNDPRSDACEGRMRR